MSCALGCKQIVQQRGSHLVAVTAAEDERRAVMAAEVEHRAVVVLEAMSAAQCRVVLEAARRRSIV